MNSKLGDEAIIFLLKYDDLWVGKEMGRMLGAALERRGPNTGHREESAAGRARSEVDRGSGAIRGERLNNNKVT